MTDIRIRVSSVSCPNCHAEEMHPTEEMLLIRGFKVCTEDGYWWSQCLVCAGYYDQNLTYLGKDAGDPDKGWF